MKGFTGKLLGVLQYIIYLFALKHKAKLRNPYPVMWPRIEARSSEQKQYN